MILTELTRTIADKVGLTSIATTVGITTAKQADVIADSVSWGMADYALAVSMVGGVLFAIEKIIVICEQVRGNREKKDNQDQS